MIVCIDTNVFVQASKAGHRLEVIFKAWFQRRFRWAISTDILAEYEEILTQNGGRQRWLQFDRVLDLAEARGDLLVHARPSYQFQLISTDMDDNKFIDCAITVDADYIITEDRHFDVLVDSGYKPRAIRPDDFIAQHLTVV